MLPTPLPVRPATSYRLVFFALIVGLLLGASAVGLSWFLTGRPGVVQPSPVPQADPAALCLAPNQTGSGVDNDGSPTGRVQPIRFSFYRLPDGLSEADES